MYLYIFIYYYILIMLNSYIYLYMYIYIYMCVYICIYIEIFIYLYIHIFIYVYVYIYHYEPLSRQFNGLDFLGKSSPETGEFPIRWRCVRISRVLYIFPEPTQWNMENHRLRSTPNCRPDSHWQSGLEPLQLSTRFSTQKTVDPCWYLASNPGAHILCQAMGPPKKKTLVLTWRFPKIGLPPNHSF